MQGLKIGLSIILLLSTGGCEDKGSVFFRDDQEIAYWNILDAAKRPTGYGYAFERTGHVEYYSHYLRKQEDRRVFDSGDVVPIDQQWRWNGDTLLVEGLHRLIFPIYPETLLMVNPKIGEVFWLAYSSDQTSPLKR